MSVCMYVRMYGCTSHFLYNTIISGNPQIWGYTPKLGGDTPKFGGDQKDEFQKFEKKIIGKIKEYYFVLFPQ